MNAFGRWLMANGHTMASFGRLAGWSKLRVYRYAMGLRRPEDDGAFAVIFRLTDGAITPNNFYDFKPVSPCDCASMGSPAGEVPAGDFLAGLESEAAHG